MKVMVSLDGSENSLRALHFITERPWAQDDEFLIVSVAELDKADLNTTQAMTNPDEVFLAEAAKLLAHAQEKLATTLPQHIVKTSELSGPVIESITDCAKGYGADLIILGSAGRTGVSRLLLGSVAEGVLRHAPCSVQIIRRKLP